MPHLAETDSLKSTQLIYSIRRGIASEIVWFDSKNSIFGYAPVLESKMCASKET